MSRNGIVTIELIKKVLPHKWPFLLIQNAVKIKDGCAVTWRSFGFFWRMACKLGHFPGIPIIPGVVIIELCAQLCAVLIISQRETPSAGLPIFNAVKAKFIEPIHPTKDDIYFRVNLRKEKLGALFFNCSVFYKNTEQEEKVLAEIEITGRDVPVDVFLEKNNGSSTKPVAQC